MSKQSVTVTINNEALAKTLSVKAGASVVVECKGGVPMTKEWRNRFKDAVKDNCIAIAKKKGGK